MTAGRPLPRMPALPPPGPHCAVAILAEIGLQPAFAFCRRSSYDCLTAWVSRSNGKSRCTTTAGWSPGCTPMAPGITSSAGSCRGGHDGAPNVEFADFSLFFHSQPALLSEAFAGKPVVDRKGAV